MNEKNMRSLNIGEIDVVKGTVFKLDVVHQLQNQNI